jgi:hypothetical protein
MFLPHIILISLHHHRSSDTEYRVRTKTTKKKTNRCHDHALSTYKNYASNSAYSPGNYSDFSSSKIIRKKSIEDIAKQSS